MLGLLGTQKTFQFQVPFYGRYEFANAYKTIFSKLGNIWKYVIMEMFIKTKN